jgi:hypothetical protein
MGLILEKKKGARDGIVGINRTIYDRAKKWASSSGYAFKSVIETAVEEFLDRKDRGGDVEEQEEDDDADPPPAARSTPPRPSGPSTELAPASSSPSSDFVVIRLEGRGPERLARILERKADGNVKVKHQTFGGPKRLVDVVITSREVLRAMNSGEINRWQELEPAVVLPPGLRNIA